MRLLVPLVALLGAAVVVLPALAASSEAKLEVNENCVEAVWPCWTSSPGSNPPPTTVTTIAPGGVVTFVDNTGTAANLAWTGAAPTCSASVPVSPAPAKAGWEGTCKFETPGHYKFESSTLYFAYTKYEIVVEAPATGTTTGTTTTGTTTTGSTNPYPNPYNYGSGSGSPTQTGGSTGSGTPAGSLLAGGASAAVKLGATQHGQSVHGAVDIAQGAAGGRLEVRLLASSASLAGAGRSAHMVVGRVVRSSLRAGRVSFAVAVDARARHALRAHGRLALSVKIVLAPAHGSVVTITRSVVLRG
ncbi:MAG TPA: hypothetical protein VK790_11245 [Solirubrobacteraceae bacterium]|nr:hypothetical protein [Solirubrobacteraceae bacterium]